VKRKGEGKRRGRGGREGPVKSVKARARNVASPPLLVYWTAVNDVCHE